MLKTYVFEREDRPAEAWAARFAAGRAAAEKWYRGAGRAEPAAAADCRAALERHMPELLPHYERACALIGGDDMARRILSQWRPPPLAPGCSQGVWLGAGGPALVRNYDFPLEVVSERFEMTSWSGRRVIAKGQRPWGGCLDGMNEDGLAVSLTAGGSPAEGEGFAVILILRYVLETCASVEEGVAALCRLPIALSQNVTLLDRSGAYATVYLGPERAPLVSTARACANHQETPASRANDARTHTLEREAAVLAALGEPGMTLDALSAQFLEAPLYSRRAASPTAYTAVYRPAEGRVDYLWPGNRVSQSFDQFEASRYTHDYGDLIPWS